MLIRVILGQIERSRNQRKIESGTMNKLKAKSEKSLR